MTRENPLETFFDMEQGTVPPIDQRTMVDVNNTDVVVIDEHVALEPNLPAVQEPAAVVPFKETLDDEDKQIAQQLQDVFDKAIAVFHTQQELTEIVDPKFAARNAEVAQQYLNTALQAVNLRAKIKADKDKQKVNAQVGAVINGNVTNNTIVANRNDLMKVIMAKKNNIDNLDL